MKASISSSWEALSFNVKYAKCRVTDWKTTVGQTDTIY